MLHSLFRPGVILPVDQNQIALSTATNTQPDSDSADSPDPQFLEDVLQGLSQKPRQLQCKYFYDQRGSELFEQICQLDEYYVTRTEIQIMKQHLQEMAEQLGAEVMLVEFGSGSSVKTRKLLAALQDPVAYTPIDISEEHLIQTAGELRDRFPEIEILPVVADFTSEIQLPRPQRPHSHAAIYFPGSTIGNFEACQAEELLVRFSRFLGPQGGLLIGIDLQKDPAILEAAYNDNEGVTAEFNLNLLHRINRDLGANFDVPAFQHRAIYNRDLGRIEMYLISQRDQTVDVAGRSFTLRKGERLLTEYSHKYTISGFTEVAARANFRLHKYWTDPQQYFAVLHLVNEQEPGIAE